MSRLEPLTTYLELRESTAEGEEGAGLSHKSGGLVLLHVLEVAAQGEPRGGVTILHDAGEHGARYLDAADALARERWAVALPDLRGHGKSEGARGHSSGLKEVVRDIDAVQKHLSYRLPTAPQALIGQGLGALYALQYALDQPGQVSALVLLGPLWQPKFDLPKPAGLLKIFKKPDPTSVGVLPWTAEQWTGDAEQQAAWKSDVMVHRSITLRAMQQASVLAASSAQRLGELAVPVLILHGGADAISDAGASRSKASSTVEVQILDGSGHALLHERNPAAVLAKIAAWLAEKVR
jgi:alpha-beta hydrolase superfamily lysophospholipase